MHVKDQASGEKRKAQRRKSATRPSVLVADRNYDHNYHRLCSPAAAAEPVGPVAQRFYFTVGTCQVA